jgi:hypothetical protein
MSTTAIVLQGLVRSDGTLEVSEKVSLLRLQGENIHERSH